MEFVTAKLNDEFVLKF